MAVVKLHLNRMDLLFSAIVSFCVLFGEICGDRGESIELYDRLNSLVNYVNSNVKSKQPDLMLGAFICRGDELFFGCI